MHPIQWTPEFAVGIVEIDDQHKQLVDMITALETGREGGEPGATRKLLRQLNDYVRDHFALEERLMATGGCEREFVVRHCGEHAYFRGALKDFTSEFEISRRLVTSSQVEYLVHWLLHHIVCVDREMAKQLHAAVPQLEAEVAALARHFTDDLTEAERHLIADLQHSNAELFQQLDALRTARASARTASAAPPDVVVLLVSTGDDGVLPQRLRVAIGVQQGLRVDVVVCASDGTELAHHMEQLAAAGMRTVKLVPLGEMPYLVPQLTGLRAKLPALELQLGVPLVQHDEVVQAMARATLQAS